MPPPVPAQSGSKAALITWTVITSILFVVATVLAIFAHVETNKLQVLLDTQKKQYDKVISQTDLNSDLTGNLEQAQSVDPKYQGFKLIEVALGQRDELARQIAGPGVTGEPGVEARAKTAAADAMKVASNAGASGDSLVSAIRALASDVKKQTDQLTQARQERDEVSKQLQGLQATFDAQLKAKDAEIAKAIEEKNTIQADVTSYRSSKDQQIEEVRAAAEQQTKLAQDDVNKLQSREQELNGQIKKLEDQIRALNNRLAALRQPVDQVVKQADANVLRTAGENLVYINLGTGDQVTPGMSFEIYDRLDGVPNPGDATTEDNLPRGKASIEIVRVQPGSSEARIVRQTPGVTVVEGDLAVNLVYDKSVKYNFVVYGNFDLDRNGQPAPQDADVIRRLVTQWGGNVMENLSVDTDFLVIGKVPTIPDYTQEELDRPEIQYQVQKHKEELAAYEDIVNRATQLNIPILNQNRFLYFVGYYEQSGR